jgi:hypothetical protein
LSALPATITIPDMSSAHPFSPAYRDRVSAQVLEWAAADHRIVAAAVVGSMATGPGDRWSDLDLSFAVGKGFSVGPVLEDWTAKLVAEFSATKLFDLPAGQSIYRVLLLPGCLQFDISFTPAPDFGAIGPHFKLLFGEAGEKPHFLPPRTEDLFGYAVHHLVRARFCIERDRLLQAEYWVSSARDYALNLACLVRGISASHGRGFDQLPTELRRHVAIALVRSIDRDSLLTAVSVTIDILLAQSAGVPELASKLELQLRTLAASWAI